MTKTLKSGQSAAFFVGSLFILSFAVTSCSPQKDQAQAPDTKSSQETSTQPDAKALNNANENVSRQFEAGEAKPVASNETPVEPKQNLNPLRQNGVSTAENRAKLSQSLSEKMSEPSRLSSATIYFKSFEFQSWTSQGADSLARRNELATLAVQEFLLEARKLKNHLNTVVNPLSDNGKYAALNALSLSMDYQSEVQIELLGRISDLKPMSILSIIEESLEIGKKLQGKINDRSDIPGYVSAVLKEKELAILLINTRINSLIFSAVHSLISDRLTQKATSDGYFSKFKNQFLANHCHIAKLSQHISPDISKIEPNQMKIIISNLQKANGEIEFLKSVDARAELHCSLKTQISLIDLAPKKNGADNQSSKLLNDELKMISLFVNLRAL